MADAQMFWRGSPEQAAVNSAVSLPSASPSAKVSERNALYNNLYGPGAIMSGYGSDASSGSDVISPPPSMLEDALQGSRSNAIDNSYLSQQFAREQMDFQAASQLAAMEFNSKEAAKNRDWQMYMSNTAHQREVRDLLAAGLNPILSAMGGNGATTGTGATASSQAMSGASGNVDTSANQAVASLVATALQAENNYEMNKVNAVTNLAIAEAQRENNLKLQERSNEQAWKIANLSADVSRYNTDMGKAIAEIYAAAQIYAANTSAGAILGSASISGAAARDVAGAYTAQQRYATDKEYDYKYWHDMYSADNPYQAIANIGRIGFSALGDLMGVLPADTRKEVEQALTSAFSRG